MFPTLADKLQARNELHDAVRHGLVIRPRACSECGDTESTIHAHHTDYAKPLEVVWLCPPCHGKAHRGKRVIVPTLPDAVDRTFLVTLSVLVDEKLREEATKERRSRQAQLVRVLEERYGLAVPSQAAESSEAAA